MAAMKIKKVYADNLLAEMENIEALLYRFPIVSLDTEFPGTVFQPESKKPYYDLTPEESYETMRDNVNCLKLIQLGLTISDEEGNFPICLVRDENGEGYAEYGCVWQFNFREFDCWNDLQNPESIAMLKEHGIDFIRNRYKGISAADFRKLFFSSGLGFALKSSLSQLNSKEVDPQLTWVFFHATYDIGFFIKLVTGRELPENLSDFMEMVHMCLGESVFDVKEMVKGRPFGWKKLGLEKVAVNLDVTRIAGERHQAGSDSLLTLLCFLKVLDKINEHYIGDTAGMIIRNFRYKLYGLEDSYYEEPTTVEVLQEPYHPLYMPTSAGLIPVTRVPVHMPFQPVMNGFNGVPLIRIMGGVHS